MSTTLLAKQDDLALKRTRRDQIRRSNERVDRSISVSKEEIAETEGQDFRIKQGLLKLVVDVKEWRHRRRD